MPKINAIVSGFYRKASVKIPETNTTVLTMTSKMPCPSWSLPARLSCPNAVKECTDGTGKTSICSQCYASKGGYIIYPEVRKAQAARWDWTRECMKTPLGQAQFVRVMVEAIRQTKTAYFRVHDSGDMFSPAYANCWYRIARILTGVKFWIPTRSYQTGQSQSALLPVLNTQNGMLDILQSLAALPNVTVRPSALFFGEAAPIITGLQAGSTADYSGPKTHACDVLNRGGFCGDCRVCWNSPKTAVSYRSH